MLNKRKIIIQAIMCVVSYQNKTRVKRKKNVIKLIIKRYLISINSYFFYIFFLFILLLLFFIRYFFIFFFFFFLSSFIITNIARAKFSIDAIFVSRERIRESKIEKLAINLIAKSTIELAVVDLAAKRVKESSVEDVGGEGESEEVTIEFELRVAIGGRTLS